MTEKYIPGNYDVSPWLNSFGSPITNMKYISFNATRITFSYTDYEIETFDDSRYFQIIFRNSGQVIIFNYESQKDRDKAFNKIIEHDKSYINSGCDIDPKPYVINVL